VSNTQPVALAHPTVIAAQSVHDLVIGL